ncbi:Rof/RNase P-like protein [Trichophaea hybrida]|nr:Rof/RNase P-like protein [Trichophaea hybrida]
MTTPDIPASSVDTYSLLLQHNPPALASEILTSKVLNKPLPLHPTTTTTTAKPDARAQRRSLRAARSTRPRKPAPLTAKEKRQLKVYVIPRKLSYATFIPLHNLWLSYAQTLATMGGGAPAMAGRLASGDLHGALVEVVRSRAVDRVGICGIVIKETRGVLEVVTEKDESKMIPKEFTLFRVAIPPKDEDRVLGRGDMVFELQGNQMMFRAAERAGKKFKAKPMLDL